MDSTLQLLSANRSLAVAFNSIKNGGEQTKLMSKYYKFHIEMVVI